MERKNFDPAMIFAIVILVTIFAFYHPIVFLLFAPPIFFKYYMEYQNRTGSSFETANNTNYVSRQNALENVQIFLAPYTSMWKNLRVSNKFCTLRLGFDGKTITGSENNTSQPYKKFKITNSKIHSYNELWDMFCLNFEYNTTYDGLIELCKICRVEYVEEIVGEKLMITTSQQKTSDNSEKIDINNASEVEITKLPGISIVLSKKIIKKREEIGGFKSIEDLFLFLKLKPHLENQLRNLICVKKMKGSVQIQKTKERRVDL